MPNGVVTQYEYKPGHLTDTKKTSGLGGSQIYFNDYEHNKRDFVTAVDENGRSFAFDYESREQLERVTTPEGDIRLYTYDGAGKRKTRSAIIGGKKLDRGETLELEEFLQMIIAAIKGQEEAEVEGAGEGKGKGHEKGNRGKGNGNGGKKSSYEEQHDFEAGEVNAATVSIDSVGDNTQFEEGKQLTASDANPQSLVYQGSGLSLYAAKGGNDKGKNGTDKGKGNDKGNGNGNDKAKGKPDETGWKNALQRGNGKKWGLYKKLGLVDGPFEHMTGQMENILAVIDNIVNGEVNLPPGEHEELFKLVREVGKGYTILGTTWDYNERNAITHKANEIRVEEYDFGHDDAGNMTTDGRSVYQWNAKGQLEKVTFPDGFGQKYEYDAKGRRTKKIQFNHQGSIQWVINYHYKGNTWQITHETDEDGNIIMEYTYDEKSRPLSVTYKGETFWYVYNGHGDVVALTDKNGEIAARYEYDEWGVVTRMYNRFGERVREGIGWIGDLNTGNGTPGSRLGPSDDNDDYDFHPGNGRGKAKGWEKNGKGQKGSGDEEPFVQSTDEDTLEESLNTVDTASREQSVTSDVYEAGTLSGDGEEVTEDITTELVKENPYRYSGYYWDRKTQFYYLQARYYNPRIARFLSLDEWRGDITHPLSLNRYVYVWNNPVNYVDPTGYCVQDSFGAALPCSNNLVSLTELVKEANLKMDWAKGQINNAKNQSERNIWINYYISIFTWHYELNDRREKMLDNIYTSVTTKLEADAMLFIVRLNGGFELEPGKGLYLFFTPTVFDEYGLGAAASISEGIEVGTNDKMEEHLSVNGKLGVGYLFGEGTIKTDFKDVAGELRTGVGIGAEIVVDPTPNGGIGFSRTFKFKLYGYNSVATGEPISNPTFEQWVRRLETGSFYPQR